MRFGMRIFVAASLSLGTFVSAQPAQPSPDETVGNIALAERVAQTAQLSLVTNSIVPATLRQSAAFLEAATRLNPQEPRFLRLLTEAYLQLGGSEGRDGAISSLTRYLAIDPNDQLAYVQLIDLHLASMETADQRKKYLDQLLATQNLWFEVRARVAVSAAKLALERTAVQESAQYLDQALTLMPLCPEALRMKYEQSEETASPTQRVALLLQMLRANPAQPKAMTELASELAAVGLVDQSISWYQQAFQLYKRMQRSASYDEITNLAAELVIGEQLTSAANVAREVIERDPANSDAAFIALLVAKRGGEEEKIQEAAQKARSALLVRLGQISNQLSGEAPTTQPGDGVNIQADLKKLALATNPDLVAAYAANLADLVWLEIYFNGKPAGAQDDLNALRQLVASDSVVLARLEGWAYLVDSKIDEAKVKLSAVAGRDPLAAMGMIRVDSGMSPDQQEAETKRLLNTHASGLLGAILKEGLRDRAKLMPLSPDATAVLAEVDKFPMEWLDWNDADKAKNFYTLKAETVGGKVKYPFSEPMLAKVTVSNTGKFDITVGQDSALRPDLWFDTQVKGQLQSFVPGVAFERLGQKLLLHPRDSMTVVVRLDQGRLGSKLDSAYVVDVPLYFSVATNPMMQPMGVVPGPGGYRASLRVVDRIPAPPTPQAVASYVNQLMNGGPDVRMRMIDLLGLYARDLRAQNAPELINMARTIGDALRRATADPVPPIRARAIYINTMLADKAAQELMIKQMISSRSFPQQVMGMLAAQQVVEPDTRKGLVQFVADSEDPALKKLAVSVIQVADLPPPATQPSEGTDGQTTAASPP